MKTDAYINKIIEETGLTKKEIQNLVTEKKDELKGLISDEGALFIIAKELGVDVKEENKDLLKDIDISIAEITSNMKNITLVGRIKEIYRINKFTKKDGSQGHVGSFLLHDNTGDIRIVLWDEQINVFNEENFTKNELVKVINGYAKNRINKEGIPIGREIHLNRLSKIIIAPEDIDYKKYPKIKEEVVKISDINLSQNSVSVEGFILQKFPIKEFMRKTGEKGKVSAIILSDSIASIRVTFWDDDTEKIDRFEEGDGVLISGLKPKLSNLDSKTIDLFITRSSNVKKTTKKFKNVDKLVEKIEELQDSPNIVSFKGVITSIDNLKKVKLKTGEEASLLSFVISDETDWIRVTVWKERAEEFSKTLLEGTGILLKNVSVRHNKYSDRKEISFGNKSILQIIDLKIENAKPAANNTYNTNIQGEYTKISSITSSGTFEIKGFIAKLFINLYEACSNCRKKIENCSCDKIGESKEPKMIINLHIDDESDTPIKTTFFKEMAEKLLEIDIESIMKFRDTLEYDNFLENIDKKLIGKDVIVKGRAKFSEYTGAYELIADNFQYVDIDKELEKIIKEIET